MGSDEATKILVADDDPEILGMLGRRFRRSGFEVLEAVDGEEALAKVRAEQPDVLVLDVMMPKKTGWEVAKALRSDPRTANLPIVILTAIGEKMNEMTSPLYDVDEYVDKPFEFADLEAKVMAALTSRAGRTSG